MITLVHFGEADAIFGIDIQLDYYIFSFWLSQGSVVTLIRWGGWSSYCYMCRSFHLTNWGRRDFQEDRETLLSIFNVHVWTNFSWKSLRPQFVKAGLPCGTGPPNLFTVQWCQGEFVLTSTYFCGDTALQLAAFPWFSDCRHTGFIAICHFLFLNLGIFTIQYNTKTRMWANAQPDGRPAKHRWRPLFNAAKSGCRPLLDDVQ